MDTAVRQASADDGHGAHSPAAIANNPLPPPDLRPGFGRLALYGMLGFSAGLPFMLFSSVLFLRLARNGASLGVIAFFAWVALLPTFKFAWAPLLDRLAIPGFGRFWGKRRSWILLAQLGTAVALVGMAFSNPDHDLPLTALWAVLLAFWTTTLEIAADAWRIELAPNAAQQAPLAAANLWGYRTAMVAASSGALIVADHAGWTNAYLLIALAAFLPFPLLVATRPDADRPARGGRGQALAAGLGVSALILMSGALGFAAIGWLLLRIAAAIGISPESNVTPAVLILCALPFLLMVLFIPRIRRARPDAPLLRSPAVGPYLDFFRHHGFAAIGILAFISLYRMGDVLALTLSKPLVSSLGYSLTQIGIADGAVALVSSMAGVALGGWIAARWTAGPSLALGAFFAGFGNFAFVWLAHNPPAPFFLYVTTVADQFGNGLAGTVFVVYLSLLVNPRHPGAQYAFLSGFAFLLPRLLAGASASIQRVIGYDGFFLLSGALSLAAILLLPLIARSSTGERPDPFDK